MNSQQIAKLQNRATVRRIKYYKEKHMNTGGTIRTTHIYSHTLEEKCEDRERKITEIRNTFGAFADRAIEGNAEADRLTNRITRGGNEILKSHISMENWILRDNNGNIIDTNIKNKIRSHNRNKEWIKKNPSRSANITNIHVDHKYTPGAYRNENTRYHNFWMKVLTKMIPTNKLKHTMKFREDSSCDFCTYSGATIEESMEHLFGECPQAIRINDEAWKEIDAILTEHNLYDINPWFNVSHSWVVRGLDSEWNMPKHLGDIGLLPVELAGRVKDQINEEDKEKKVEKLNKIMNEIKKTKCK
jgi:hypothetical protein